MRKNFRKNSKENVCINTNRKYADSKYNGFTLIELLAIIVILAIIAVITVPLILGIINDAKLNSITDSAYGYKDSINKYYAQQLLTNQNLKLNDTYTVTNGTLSGGDFGDSNITSLPIQVSGTVPTSGSLTYSNNKLTSGCLKIGDYAVTFSGENVTNTTKGECIIPPSVKYASLIVTSGDGLYESTTEPGRLIYRGANPDNRIFLKEDGTNNTLYRIVSYETDGTIKVVRDEKLFNKQWDEANVRKSDGTNNTYCTSEIGCNVWGSQETMLHNGSSLGDSFHYIYYSSPTATTLSNGGSGKVGTESTLNIYLNDGSWTSLSNLEGYIDNHSWNVGGVYYTADDKGIVKEKEEERQLQWNGKVGLLNITEYAEASLNPTCTSVRSNYGSESGSPCKELNWTYKNYYQWSLSPISNSRSLVCYVGPAGYFSYFSSNDATSSASGVRPAFYLKSQINLSGSGASGDEYTIE